MVVISTVAPANGAFSRVGTKSQESAGISFWSLASALRCGIRAIIKSTSHILRLFAILIRHWAFLIWLGIYVTVDLLTNQYGVHPGIVASNTQYLTKKRQQ